MDKTNSKIAIVGGHLTPAQAVLDELIAQKYHNIIWIGQKSAQFEYKIITAKNVKFINIYAGKIWRKWTKATFWIGLGNLFLIPVGLVNALIILIKDRPKLIISFGGYVALPVVIVGWMLGIKSITHEQTITSGLANRIIAKFSKKVLISWPSSSSHYPAGKTVLTGNPLRQEIFQNTTNKFDFKNNLPIIYITGGSQGANTINWRLNEILEKLLVQFNIIHQCGNSNMTNDFAKAQQKQESLPGLLKSHYVFAANFFGPEIGEIFAKASLIVSRAGANTVSEIIALDKYALFIPIPWSSEDEQQKNAEYAVEKGNGEILKQYDQMKPEELYQAILTAFEHSKIRPTTTKKTGSQNANQLIVDQITELL